MPGFSTWREEVNIFEIGAHSWVPTFLAAVGGLILFIVAMVNLSGDKNFETEESEEQVPEEKSNA